MWPKRKSWSLCTNTHCHVHGGGTVWMPPAGCLLANWMSLATTCRVLRVLFERRSVYFMPSKAKCDLQLAQDGLLGSRHLPGGSTHKLLLLLSFHSFYISLTYIYNICVCVTRTVHITVDYFKTLDQQKLSKEWGNSFSQEPETFLKCFLNINRNQEVFW